jgi:hypothetical protein
LPRAEAVKCHDRSVATRHIVDNPQVHFGARAADVEQAEAAAVAPREAHMGVVRPQGVGLRVRRAFRGDRASAPLGRERAWSRGPRIVLYVGDHRRMDVAADDQRVGAPVAPKVGKQAIAGGRVAVPAVRPRLPCGTRRVVAVREQRGLRDHVPARAASSQSLREPCLLRLSEHGASRSTQVAGSALAEPPPFKSPGQASALRFWRLLSM